MMRIHINKKWWYITWVTTGYIVVSREKAPSRRVRHKSHIGKVMALAALALVLPKTLLLGAAAVTVLWSSHTATNFVAARLKAQHISFGEQKLLIMFPCLLIYSLFSLLSMY